MNVLETLNFLFTYLDFLRKSLMEVRVSLYGTKCPIWPVILRSPADCHGIGDTGVSYHTRLLYLLFFEVNLTFVSQAGL